jgi:hypothetical protein
LYWQDEAAVTPLIPLSLNGVWFNYARCQNASYTKMSDVPKQVAAQLKHKLAQLAPRLVGRTLTVQLFDGRMVTRTEHDNLFGFVKRGQEQLLNGVAAVVIRHMAVTQDGNVQTIVEPV